MDSGEKVGASIKKKYPKVDAEVWYLDLMDFKSIKAFVERAQGLVRLDVLINNAGSVLRSFYFHLKSEVGS